VGAAACYGGNSNRVFIQYIQLPTCVYIMFLTVQVAAKQQAFQQQQVQHCHQLDQQVWLQSTLIATA
jgi:hypothetical protein